MYICKYISAAINPRNIHGRMIQCIGERGERDIGERGERDRTGVFDGLTLHTKHEIGCHKIKRVAEVFWKVINQRKNH